MGKIYQSTDYQEFHFIDGNRRVREKYVKTLSKKMKTMNLLQYQPIFVTKDGGIIEGQHRFEAACLLNLPVYFTMAEWGDDDPRTEQALVMLNTNVQTWRQEEFLQHYAFEKGGIFRELQDFYDANRWLGISNAIAVFSEPIINAANLKAAYSGFHRNPHLDRIMAFLSSEQVRGMAYSTGRQRYFVCAIRDFIQNHTNSQVAKLLANIDRVTKQASKQAYMIMFENIINRRSVKGVI